MFVWQQIIILEWFLKGHSTLKTGVMMLKIQLFVLLYKTTVKLMKYFWLKGELILVQLTNKWIMNCFCAGMMNIHGRVWCLSSEHLTWWRSKFSLALIKSELSFLMLPKEKSSRQAKICRSCRSCNFFFSSQWADVFKVRTCTQRSHYQFSLCH